MIKHLLTASIFSVVLFGTAQQLPNAGFENWSSGSPVSWGNLDDMLANDLFVTGTTQETQVSPGNSGSSACELKTQSVTIPPFGANTIPGVVNSGPINFDMASFSPVFGRIPYAGMPTDYTFYYKFSTVAGGDTAGTQVIFTKWNTGTNKTDTIGYGGDTIVSAASSFTLRSVPITWLVPGTVPDSVSMLFISSISSAPQINTSFIIDDINMVLPSGISENFMLNDIAVYPNPATDAVTFSSKSNKASLVENFDFAGKRIATEKFQDGKVKLTTSELSSGVYMYRIVDAEGAELKSSKFSVTK